VESESNRSHGARFELLLDVTLHADGIRVDCSYQADLFFGSTIARWLGYFRNLLAAAAADPMAPLWRLCLLSEAERRQLLGEWSGELRDPPHDPCVQELFALQAARRPHAVALLCGDARLTYGELDARSNRLARYLQGLGVGPEVAVGVALGRTPQLVVALLAILKAGGAYLALEPSYPAERLAFMIEDARLPVLLTEKDLQGRLPAGAAPILCLDTARGAIARCSAAGVRGGGWADGLMYTTYTSGSTGLPKGIQVTHRSVVRLVEGADYVRLGADEVVLQLAPVAFDASTFEIWGSLLNGAQLVLLPVRVPSLEELGQALGHYRVTTLFLTTALFHQLVEERLADLAGLRQLLTGGEVLSSSRIRQALGSLTAGTLIACYGPTENTTFTTCDALRAGDAVGASVSLGRPIADRQVFILDGHLETVPIGVAGQLCTGGEGLARGYLRRPELTAEKFVPHPFSCRPGARLYLTGDLARWSPDGRLDFLGRFDHQVKIRGFRIELGEIEATLGLHPAVQAAVVLAPADAMGGKRLLAYVAASREEAIVAAELAAFLKSRLPEYMVPSGFIQVESMPLTANGKVDRRALAALGTPLSPERGELQAPATRLEAKLAQIWGEVLGLERVSVQDDFFALGGHSLLATRVVARIGHDLGVSVPLR
ncbi:MAG TPA: non-ribosomal peptide synthetase, partial [Thermoanaerobaculia bacterium]|nr:non-ribosomal peptide synthetase [Thermoanaerobaculia bacterium]